MIWLAFLAIDLYLLYHWRGYQQSLKGWRLTAFFGLLTATLVFSLFIGLRLPAWNALPLPGTPAEPTGAVLMFMAALPWCMAAGLLGPIPTAVMAGLSGGLIGFFDSHNPFLPLVYILMGILLSVFSRQRYRTFGYRMLRHPLLAGGILSAFYPVLFVLSTVLVAGDTMAIRLDYAISHTPGAWLAFTIQMLWGLVFAEVLAMGLPKIWYAATERIPSPSESNLEARLVSSLAPVAAIFIVFLVLGVWITMVNSSRQLLAAELKNVANATAESIPFALETGQNLLVQLKEDERLINTSDPAQVTRLLVEYLNRVPFFNQLTYLDTNQELVAAYPVADYPSLFLSNLEKEWIDLTVLGVSFQMYSLPPVSGETSSRLVFIAGVTGEDDQLVGILLGHTTLVENPFFIPLLENLASLKAQGGAGMLVDDAGIILFHPDADLIGAEYTDEINLEQSIFDPQHTNPQGIREILVMQPVPGRAWVTVATFPVAAAQQVALETALPLLGIFLLLLVVLYYLLRLRLRAVTSSIKTLAEEAGRISTGDLEHSLTSERVDEVGQLSKALEEMRLNLRSRIEEINRLLSVSKGVASALEMEMAVKPILQGALSTGASSARLVLTEAAIPEYEPNIRTQFGLGPSAEEYSGMDAQILALTVEQNELVLTNPARSRLTNPGKKIPQTIMAVALHHENVHYGGLWVAFDQPHHIAPEEQRFLAAVAGQAALAASNARLYLSAQLGRQRMEAILESTPEPVLVTDHQDRVLLVNPAARELFGDIGEKLEGRAVKEVVQQKALVDLLLGAKPDANSAPLEVTFPNQKVFFATASPIIVDGQKMGRVCLLRDITHFKELDAMKTEFVATVSHDLRSPLTTLRGYATMMDMVGDLNEQQTRYLKKIGQGIENMSRLVVTLLNLGRIEAGIGLQLEMVPVSDLVQQVAEALRLEAVQRQLKLEVHLPQNTMPLVQADKVLLVQAAQNLIDNAIKFTRAGGLVEVSVTVEEEQQVAITVKDTGVGIAPVDLPRLFERFYRGGGRAMGDERGSGLGLAIVKSIAERHGGSVSVESQLGKGSIFTMRIPLRQPEKEPA